MKATKLRNLSEEIQDYVAANFLDSTTGLPVYTVDGASANFTLEDYADIQDLEKVTTSNRVILTLFYDSGTLTRTGKQAVHYANYRFMAKGTTPTEAMDRCRALLEWLEDERTFVTTTFRVWMTQFPKLPSLVMRGENGSYLADFVMAISAHTRR